MRTTPEPRPPRGPRGKAAARPQPAGDREVLLRESVLDKFLRYVRIDTQSDPAGPSVPTTPGQWDLLRLLAAEAEAMGLQDVELDGHGILTATIPSTLPPGRSCPTIAFLAHVDTSPAVSGRGVRPLVHRRYAGGPIRLPAGPVLDPAEQPALQEAVGLDIVTSDGSTLLGADDKAGVAEIMAAAARWLADPDLPHGPVRIAFTPDEETGRGIEFLDVARLGAQAAYTLDGGILGEVAWENFYAENLTVVLEGRAAHTGSARGHMINAVALAAALVAAVPRGDVPETSDGRGGFVHFDTIRGSVERVELSVLLRDFEAEGLQRRRRWLEQQLEALRLGHPGVRIDVRRTGGYRNMREAVDRRPEVVQLALAAIRAAGVTPRPAVIRGGTDGARLSERGLPTPNLFAGGMDFHSRTEWIVVQWMEKAVEVIVHLARLWAEADGR
jgi:tripeptide aminopeptidase